MLGKFAVLESPEVDLPGRASDEELKGAQLVWRSVEPVRWDNPEVLLLERHEYFEGKHPDRSINSIGRTYDIRHEITTGTATAKVKKFND